MNAIIIYQYFRFRIVNNLLKIVSKYEINMYNKFIRYHSFP